MSPHPCTLRRASIALAVLLPSTALARQEFQGPAGLAWTEPLGIENAWFDEPSQVEQAAGRSFVVGRALGGAPDSGVALLYAYESDGGALLWKRQSEPAYGLGKGVVHASPDGARVVQAYRTAQEPNAQDKDVELRAWSASSGALLWSSSIASEADERVARLQFAPDGATLYAVGTSTPVEGLADVLVRALDASSGDLLWSRELDSLDSWNPGQDLLCSPDGERLYVLSRTSYGPIGFGSAIWTQCLASADGGLLWEQLHDGGGPFQSVSPRALALSASGSTLVSVCANTGVPDLVAYDALSGAPVWEAHSPVNIAASAADAQQLYLAGSQPMASTPTFASAAFALDTGQLNWHAQHASAPGFGVDELQGAIELVAPAGTEPLLALARNLDSAGAPSWLLVQQDPSAGDLLAVAPLAAGPGFVAADLDRVQGDALVVGRLGAGVDEQRMRLLRAQPATGSPLWLAEDEHAELQPSAVVALRTSTAHELVLAGVQAPSGGLSRASLIALEGDSGEQRWSVALEPASVALQSLLVDAILDPQGALVYALWRESDGAAVSTTRLEARSLADGSLVWGPLELALSLQGNARAELSTSPDGARLLVDAQTFQRQIDCFDASTGLAQWQALVPYQGLSSGAIATTPLALDLDDARLYLMGNYGLLQPQCEVRALDLASGQTLWTQTWEDAAWLTPRTLLLSEDGSQLVAHAATSGCCSSAGPDAYLLALDAQTGALGTQVEYGALLPGESLVNTRVVASPIDGSVILAGSRKNMYAAVQIALFARSADLSTELWSTPYAGGLQAELQALAMAEDGVEVLFGTRELDPFSPPLERVVWSAHSVRDGALRWSASWPDPTPTALSMANAGPDAEGRIAFELPAASPLALNQLVSIQVADFSGTPSALSLQAGGTQSLELRAGLDHAGEPHLILGSLTGTSPGLPLGGGLLLPLSFDTYTLLSLTQPSAGPVQGALGSLSPTGTQTASLSLPSGSPPSLAGQSLFHAYVTWNASGLSSVSQAVALELLP